MATDKKREEVDSITKEINMHIVKNKNGTYRVCKGNKSKKKSEVIQDNFPSEGAALRFWNNLLKNGYKE